MLASLADVARMTPRSDDLLKNKLSVRDAVWVVVGALAMYGAQIGVQWGMRADIRELTAKFDSYVQRQTDTNGSLQRQIDEWRAETKLNRVNIENNERTMAELKGLLTGAGIKGVPK